MNSDQELLLGVKRLSEIALIHSKCEHDNEELDEAFNILKNIQIYSHKMSAVRSVQLSQIEDNVMNIRRILNQPAIEGHYPKISHYIDNLVTYCGCKTQI